MFAICPPQSNGSTDTETNYDDMAPSKFVEILDTSDTPYSHADVSLDDVLKETRHRSSSANGSSDKSLSRDSSPITREPVKTRLRGFSLKKSKT